MPPKSHPWTVFGIFNEVPFVTAAGHGSHKRTGILGAGQGGSACQHHFRLKPTPRVSLRNSPKNVNSVR